MTLITFESVHHSLVPVSTKALSLIIAFFETIFMILRLPLSSFKRRWAAWQYLFIGPSMIQQGYDKANGRPFEISAPDTRYVFVSSAKQIKEIDDAPDGVLSLHAATKQMLQPKYTMYGFDWLDRRGIEGIGFVRAIRSLLTSNLPHVLPQIKSTISDNFTIIHQEHPIVGGLRRSPVYPMIVRLTVITNALAFFGETLARDEQFTNSAFNFIEETLKTAEIVRLLPSFIAPSIGQMLAGRLSSHKIINDALISVTEDRLQARSIQKVTGKVGRYNDCIQWIMDTSPKQNPWSAQRIVHEVIAIWFGSVHAISTTVCFAIHDLCLHPEHSSLLRKELEGPEITVFEKTAQGLPLLDSFIKESARLTPVESMSTRRQTLQPFTFLDGTSLNVGDWACTPSRAMATDPEEYPEPLDFNGFRFVDPQLLIDYGAPDYNQKRSQASRPSKFTDTDSSWQVWGTGRITCPGRFYASAVIKTMLVHVILNYDCELVDKNASRWFTWRSSTIPREKTMVLFKSRSPTEGR